jgi:hypothetical protein
MHRIGFGVPRARDGRLDIGVREAERGLRDDGLDDWRPDDRWWLVDGWSDERTTTDVREWSRVTTFLTSSRQM